MTRSIGGRLDITALAALSGRDQHVPIDRESALRAAQDLARQGLTARDISQALSLSEGAVRDLLGEHEPSYSSRPA